MKEGAYDYLTKPFKVDELRIVMEKALEKKVLSSENRRLRQEIRSRSRHASTSSATAAPMQEVFDLIAQVAETKTNVLVYGRERYGQGARRPSDPRAERTRTMSPSSRSIVGRFPENLLESELFGHVKGAFTGAVQNKEGLFAGGGGRVALSRRDRRALGERSRSSCLRAHCRRRPSGASVTTRRSKDRRADRIGDESTTGGGGGRRSLPRGSSIIAST